MKRLLALTGLVLGCFTLSGASLAGTDSIGIIQSSVVSRPVGAIAAALQPDATSPDGLIHTFSLGAGERANAVAFSPDSGVLVVGTAVGVHIYDLQDFHELRRIKTDVWVRSLALSPDGSLLAGALFDDTIRVWSISDGTQVVELTGHTGWVRSVAFSSDGTVLASASDDNTVRLWRIPDRTLIYSLGKDTQGVRSAAFSPDDKILAAGTADGLIHLWDVKTGALLKTLEGHEGWVRALAFSHDGSLLASGAFDATVRIWRVADGTLLHELKGHSSSVLSVAFTPDDKTLATGSVDSTIRLWRVGDGQTGAILAGHQSFVYGIAISPDGARLASASEDGTARLWDIYRPEEIAGTYPQAGSSDCRLCHHPRGTTIAPPVLEVRCESCHTGGAVLNWCPMFPRLTKAPFTTPGYTVSAKRAGVPVPSNTLSVVIASPGNGETYYVRPEFTAPLQVRGHVGDLNGDVSGLNVSLEAWSGEENLGTLQTPLQPDGGFSFDLGINPGAAFPVRSSEQIDAGSIICDTCHTKYAPDLYVREGDIHLIVSVTDPDGGRATDDRWVNVDISTVGALEVRVVDADSGQPVPGLSVQASTRLYEWRPRSFTAIANGEGIAQISAEVLKQASTIYSISIPKQVSGGVVYEGLEATEVVYAPDTPALQSVVLQVRSQRGEILGKIEAQEDAASGSETIWAVQLPSGPAFQTVTSQGTFSFHGLPVAKYLLFSDVENMQTVDLSSAPVADVTLLPSPAHRSQQEGSASAHEDGWLPFAWLTLPGGEARPVDLPTGAWKTGWDDLDVKAMTLSAPGYYSQVIGLLPAAESNGGTAISLNRRPGMRVLPWGDGAILLPPETQADYQEGILTLDSGWAWGTSGTSQELKIVTPEAEIELVSGRFALSRLIDQDLWLYLLDGTAQIRSKKTGETLLAESGMMVAVEASGKITAMLYEPAVFAALNSMKELPVSTVWEPTLSARLQKRLVEARFNCDSGGYICYLPDGIYINYTNTTCGAILKN